MAKSKKFDEDIEDTGVAEYELSDEEVQDVYENAPSMEKIPDIRASGHCQKCGRYTAVPVIKGVPQCKCHQ